MSRAHHPSPVAGRRLRPSGVAAVALTLIVAGSAVAAQIHGSPKPDQPHSPPSPPPAAAPVGSAPATAEPSMAVQPELRWPLDTRLRSVAGLDLPVSATSGPLDTNRGRARRFAHTQPGAVLAGLHLLVRTSPQVGPALWGPTLDEQVVGLDHNAYVAAVRRDYENARERLQLPADAPLGVIYASIRGIRVDAYSPQACSMRVLIEAPGADGVILRAATVVQVSWSGSDWQLVAPPGGDWARVRTYLPAGAAVDFTPLPGR